MNNEKKKETREIRKESGRGDKKKRKSYSVEEKLRILDELERKQSSRSLTLLELSNKYGIPERCIRSWRANRAGLLKFNEINELSRTSKRMRITPLETVDQALYVWFDWNEKLGVPLTGPQIRTKALDLHAELGIEKKFAASEGWLHHWKKRYDIKLPNQTGHQKSSSSSSSSSSDLELGEFRKLFEDCMIKDNLQSCQIFTAGETILNYKSLPERSVEGKSKFGSASCKDQVTVMICSNADASLKFPLVVIGKSANPKAIRKLGRDSLPVYYESQQRGRMNCTIFETWLESEFVPSVTKFLKDKNLPARATLFINNSSSHLSALNFEFDGIKVQSLPQNTKASIQPMKRGIINNLKQNYRSLFTESIIYAQNNDIDVTTHLRLINIKDVIYWLCNAWNEVSSEIIMKSWYSLSPSHFCVGNEDSVSSNTLIDDIVSNVRQINNYGTIEGHLVESWINSDDEPKDKTLEMPSNQELIEMVTGDDSEEDVADGDNENLSTHPNNVVSAADSILSFLENNKLLISSDLAVILKIKHLAMKISVSNAHIRNDPLGI